jgi:hypothetical protein
LSITTPRYGFTVKSPLTVGGRITGVDESLRIQVRTLGNGRPLGEADPVPAGGLNQSWSITLPYRSTRSGVITVAVSTGGHLHQAEEFAITGLRTVPSPRSDLILDHRNQFPNDTSPPCRQLKSRLKHESQLCQLLEPDRAIAHGRSDDVHRLDCR